MKNLWKSYLSGLIALLLFFGVSASSSADQRTISNQLKALRHNETLKIAFGSCIAKPVSQIWDTVLNTNPDLLLLLGDNLYFEDFELADIEKMRAHYQFQFNSPQLKNLITKIPTLAIWDDHDFGYDNSDSTFQYKNLSLKVFREQWKNPAGPPGLENLVAFQVDFDWLSILMTDNRTERVNGNTAETRTYFGNKQLDWIEKELLTTKKKMVIIASGDEALGDYAGSDALRMYRKDRERLFKAISLSKAVVVVISGDLHHSQVLERPIGDKKVLEISASPFTSAPSNIENESKDKNNIGIVGKINNFGFLEISNRKGKISLKGSIIDKTGKTALEVNRDY